jgi:hypothetical protein
MGKDPVNVTRLIRLNDRLAKADDYHKNMQKGSQVAAWHENKMKHANAPTKVQYVPCICFPTAVSTYLICIGTCVTHIFIFAFVACLSGYEGSMQRSKS